MVGMRIWHACRCRRARLFCIPGAPLALSQAQRVHEVDRIVDIGMSTHAALNTDRIGGEILPRLGVVVSVEIIVKAAFFILPLAREAQCAAVCVIVPGATVASPQGLCARQRFLGHKWNICYATSFNLAIGSLSGRNSSVDSRFA